MSLNYAIANNRSRTQTKNTQKYHACTYSGNLDNELCTFSQSRTIPWPDTVWLMIIVSCFSCFLVCRFLFCQNFFVFSPSSSSSSFYYYLFGFHFTPFFCILNQAIVFIVVGQSFFLLLSQHLNVYASKSKTIFFTVNLKWLC